jgi:hypothetical protein
MSRMVDFIDFISAVVVESSLVSDCTDVVSELFSCLRVYLFLAEFKAMTE